MTVALLLMSMPAALIHAGGGAGAWMRPSGGRASGSAGAWIRAGGSAGNCRVVSVVWLVVVDVNVVSRARPATCTLLATASATGTGHFRCCQPCACGRYHADHHRLPCALVIEPPGP